jgi:hypothetical protein
MPSERESFGLMAIEAMSCGKVVLALDTPSSALSSTINSPRCGIAVQASQFAAKLEDLLDSVDYLRELEANSLDFARKNYSQEVFLERTLTLYRNVIDNFSIENSFSLINAQLSKFSSGYRQGDLQLVEKSDAQQFKHVRLLQRLKWHYKIYGSKVTIQKIFEKVEFFRRRYGTFSLFKYVFTTLKNSLR